MRFPVSAVVFLLVPALAAGELEVWFSKLPDPAASIAGHDVSRQKAEMLFRKTSGNAAVKPHDYSNVLKQALTEEACRIALLERLAAHGIVPDYGQTLNFLQKLNAVRPDTVPPMPPMQMVSTAQNPDIQLQVALQTYLVKIHPDKLVISDEAAEDFYRENQELFLRSPVLDTNIIRLAKTQENRQLLRQIQSRLLQGENFAGIAEKLGDKLLPSAEISPELLRRNTEKLAPGETGQVIELPDSWMLIQLRNKRPASYIPFDEVREYISLLLASGQAGKELAGEISPAVNRTSVKYYGSWAGTPDD